MKKTFLTLTFAAAAFFAFALTASAEAPKTAPSKQVEAVSVFDGATPETLVLKKQKVDTDLRTTLTLLNGAYSRIQIAISRLSDKKIDTGTAQSELTLAGSELIEAKATVDAFSKITLSEEKLQAPNTAASLKLEAKKAEDALAAVRGHLIASLSILKTALTAPTETQ